MATNSEVDRLRAVYDSYDRDVQIQAQWSPCNPGNQAIEAERDRCLRRMLAAAGLLPLTNRRILELGCGSGKVLAGLTHWGAVPRHLYGIDLLPEQIDAARHAFPKVQFQTGNAEQLPFADQFFDLVLLFTVFTSVLNRQMAQNIACEVLRVLKIGGAAVWYDFRFRNPRNPHVRAMTRRKIQALFPTFEPQLRTVTLLPPLARRLGPATSLLYPVLAGFPPLRTHYMGLLWKRSN
jgi:ubiquinone/menaquinone biosynthesis C-methylase UbiE